VPGRILAVKILLISGDPRVREWMGLVVRSVARSTGEQPEFIEASDGVKALKLASRFPPDVVVADEITSRAGAFAVTRDLKGGAQPFAGRVVIFLEREQDAWLAAWSGADAWFVKPVNPFEVADTIAGFFEGGQKEAV
jgi:DNA-binding response OmpR family regulator